MTEDINAPYESKSPSETEFNEIAKQAYLDPTGEGFAILGQEVLGPVAGLLDYESLLRKLVKFDNLPSGFAPIAEKRKIATFIDVEADRLTKTDFEMYRDRARLEMLEGEDSWAYEAICAKAHVGQPLSSLTLSEDLDRALAHFKDRFGTPCTRMLINRRDLMPIMIAGLEANLDRDLVMAGYYGTYKGATVMSAPGTGVVEVAKEKQILFLGAPETVGEAQLTVSPFTETYNLYPIKEFRKGWCMCEMIYMKINESCAAMIAEIK